MSALAVGALLAGCVGVASGAPADPGSGAATDPGAGAGVDAAGPRAGARVDAADRTAPQLPEAWDGTLSAESLPAADGPRYLVLQQLRGEQADAVSLSSEELLSTEFLASQSAECEGTATRAGDSARCMLQADVYGGSSGPKAPAEVRLVQAASGASALLISVDGASSEPLALADDTPLGLSTVDGVAPDEVTAAELEGAVSGAVTSAEPLDGALPEELRAQCVVLEEGLHAVCEVDGTDAGGGDGLWYATVQPGLVRVPGDGTTYLFSQLPS